MPTYARGNLWADRHPRLRLAAMHAIRQLPNSRWYGFQPLPAPRERPEARIALPHPGIGLGRLDPVTVRPLLERLPANVTVWRC